MRSRTRFYETVSVSVGARVGNNQSIKYEIVFALHAAKALQAEVFVFDIKDLFVIKISFLYITLCFVSYKFHCLMRAFIALI